MRVGGETILDGIADGIVAFDPETGEILAVNDSCCELLGVESTELSGACVTSLGAGPTGGSDDSRLLEFSDRAHADGSVEFIWLCQPVEDRPLPVSVHLSVENRSDRRIAVASLRPLNATSPGERWADRAPSANPSRDDTEWGSIDTSHQSERAHGTPSDRVAPLFHSTPGGLAIRYRRMLERSSDYVVVVDETGRITYSSPGVETVLGYAPQTLTGTDAFAYVHPEDRPRVRAAFSAKLENPYVERQVTYRTLRSDGTVVWTEARGGNYLDDPFIEGVLVTIRDVTDEVTYRRRLETHNRLLERLADVLSHDLKTPISTAAKIVTVLRSDLEEPSERVDQSLDHLKEVLGDLHAFADNIPALARQSTSVEDPTECSLETVARSAWNAVDTGSLEIQSEGDRSLEGDPDRLRRAFQNLYENVSVHATGATTVTVGPTSEGIFVADDGSGIDPVCADDLFEIGTTTGAGSGLGLAIVRSIVNAHGWSITVSESERGGTRFDIEITQA